jgi:glycosyltransferase involved in cell wall biosynthesis
MIQAVPCTNMSSIYYLDAGIVNNIGHNLETVEFLSHHLGENVDFTLVAGRRFSGSIKNLHVYPLLKYGSPHWSSPSVYMRYLQAGARQKSWWLLDEVIHFVKSYEVKRDLRYLHFVKNSTVIINSMELDDAYIQCKALLAIEPSLSIKVIMHYSPFLSNYTAIRPKLKKAIAGFRRKSRVFFYGDTTKLCQVYGALLLKPVTLLPIPHAMRGQGIVRHSAPPPYRVLYFGTYSEAKTPHLIPEVISRIASDVPLEWEVCITYIAKNRVIEAFERELRVLETKTGKTIYHTGPFTTQRIEDMFAQSDILLIPYHSHDYEIQSSGVVMEALVSGKIPIISRSMADASMLAEVDPCLVFRPNNEMDMVASLEYVGRNYVALQEKLRPLQQKMEAFHNPDSFIQTLLR